MDLRTRRLHLEEKIYDAQVIQLMDNLHINEITAREILDSLNEMRERLEELSSLYPEDYDRVAADYGDPTELPNPNED